MKTDAASNAVPAEPEASDLCPECGSDDTIHAHGFTACGVETNYQACCACNYQWGHQ